MTSRSAAHGLRGGGFVVEGGGAGSCGVTLGGYGGDAANLRAIRHRRGSLIREVAHLKNHLVFVLIFKINNYS